MNTAYIIKHLLNFIIPKPTLRALSEMLDPWYCRASVKHISGTKRIKYRKDEVIVTCLVRNGGAYIKSFVEHYFTLGVKHIVFLDNGSDDNTISLARDYDNVTILSSKVFLAKHRSREVVLRHYLAKRFCRNRWCLNVDIDELFDYPFSNVVSLSALLAYLNANSYTAVVSQMLDMFSDRTLNELRQTEDVPIECEYKYYDISDILRQEYFEDDAMLILAKGNVIANENIKFYIGGIRKTIFGTNNWLTKHPLIFIDRVRITHPHCVSNARCADFTAVLLHYKFVRNYCSTAERYAREGFCVAREYAAIVSESEKYPHLSFKRETARQLYSVNDLVENSFLIVSEEYLGLLRNVKQSMT